jgi:hypothetical protein
VQDELPDVDNTELEFTKGCQGPFSCQDPHNEVLAAVCDSELCKNPPQRRANDISYSPNMTPALAATAPQKSAVAIYGQSAAPAKNPSTISESNDPEMSE